MGMLLYVAVLCKPFNQDQNIAHIVCDKIFLDETVCVVWNFCYVVFAWWCMYAFLKTALNSLVVDLCMENPIIFLIAQSWLVKQSQARVNW